jgi:hypothetical protein
MDYEVVPDRDTPGVWRVEWTVDEGEGSFCLATFTGPDARAQAEAYAEEKSRAAGRELVGAGSR